MLYTYDKNGNITSVSDGTNTTRYLYDSANQLIQEANEAGDFTRAWYYDDAGNILTWTIGEYTDEPLSNADLEDIAFDRQYYAYSQSAWGDLLIDNNANEVDHDTIGNPLYDGLREYTWEHGRELTTVTQYNITWSLTYNADGLRTARWEEERSYEYVYTDGRLQGMEYNGTAIYFTHAPDGTPLSMTTGGQTYYYVTNLQGDIVAILDSAGNPVVQYTYDAWGRHLSTTGTLASTIGTLNPLRYRGYVYDVETGLYYVSSRYYDPEIGRWINADALVDQRSVLGYNLFAYCRNNPVNMTDTTGNLPFFAITAAIGAVVGAVVGGVVAAKNGGNVWAGIGIGATAGALIGTGAGMAAGAALAGSITATTGAVMAGGSALVATVGTGGLGAGATYIANNLSQAANNLAPAAQTAASKMQEVATKGKAGEALSGLAKNTSHIPSLTGTASYRIPDGLDAGMRILSEVKNYSGTLSYTNQLKDFVMWSQANGYQMHLYTNATLTGPLQQVVDSGIIQLFPLG